MLTRLYRCQCYTVELIFCSFSLVTQSSFSHAFCSAFRNVSDVQEKNLRKIDFQFNCGLLIGLSCMRKNLRRHSTYSVRYEVAVINSFVHFIDWQSSRRIMEMEEDEQCGQAFTNSNRFVIEGNKDTSKWSQKRSFE